MARQHIVRNERRKRSERAGKRASIHKATVKGSGKAWLVVVAIGCLAGALAWWQHHDSQAKARLAAEQIAQAKQAEADRRAENAERQRKADYRKMALDRISEGAPGFYTDALDQVLWEETKRMIRDEIYEQGTAPTPISTSW